MENDYKRLSKEDKLHNLNITKKNLEEKIQNLTKQLQGINRKIEKLQNPEIPKNS